MARANRPAIASATRTRGPDRAVGEVIAYVFMMIIGTLALTIAVNILADTREDSDRIARAIQLKQAGQIVAANVAEAARVADRAPTASYEQRFDIPAAIADRTYSGTITSTAAGTCASWTLELETASGNLTATIPLGEAGQVQVDGVCLELSSNPTTFSSSAQRLEIRYAYDPSPGDGTPDPTLYIEPSDT